MYICTVSSVRLRVYPWRRPRTDRNVGEGPPSHCPHPPGSQRAESEFQAATGGCHTAGKSGPDLAFLQTYKVHVQKV